MKKRIESFKAIECPMYEEIVSLDECHQCELEEDYDPETGVVVCNFEPKE